MVEGLLIRPAEPGDIDRLIDINIAVWDTTYRGIVNDAILDGMTPDSLRGKWERIMQNIQTPNGICFVAVLRGEVVGFVMCGKNVEPQFSFEWTLYSIYIYKEYQGQGIGKALFHQAVEAMRARQVRSFTLFVLEENHATCKFYESLGPDYQAPRTISLGDVDYAGIGYGWSRI